MNKPTGTKRCLVLFSAYFTTDELPNNLKLFLTRISPYAAKLVFLTQEDRELSLESAGWLGTKGIQLQYVKNQGMDFGMWSNAHHLWKTGNYDSLLLANDSCISIRDLTEFFIKATNSHAQLIGMTDSMKKGHHLQSYFLLAKSPESADAVVEFIESKKQFLETTEKYSDIVNTCEIGLSQHIQKKGLKIEAIWPFAPNDPLFDPSYILAHHNAKNGMPLVKKKALIGNSNKALRFQAYNNLEIWPGNIVNDLITNHGCQVSEDDEIHSLAKLGNTKVAKRTTMLKRIQLYRRLGLFKNKYLIPSCQ